MSLPFRYLLLLLVSCCIPSFARAEEIEVRQGTVSITVPVPEGFAVLGPETKDFKDIYAERLAMGSEMLAIIIPSGDSPSPRQMDVEVVRSLKGHDFTKGDLELMRKASNPDQLLNGLKETSGRSGIAMEPVHDSSERYYSFLVHDREAETCTVVTSAVIRGRLWVLAVRSLEKVQDEEQWLKTTAKAWVASVFAASPSDAAALAIENRVQTKQAKSGAEKHGWPEILADGIFILLIVFLVVKLTRKKPDPSSGNAG